MKLACALVAALCVAACSRESAPPAPRVQEVGVVTVHTQSVPVELELTGRTTASLISDVRPQVAGIIKSRKFVEGSLVKAGDVLYEIDPSSYQAAADQAKATLTSAEAAVDTARLKSQRYDELAAMQGVSKQDAEDARVAYNQDVATVDQARAALNAAQINLSYTQVRAPISGRIGTSSVTPGALVTASQTTALATIRALDPIYVDLTQSSASLLALKRAMSQRDLKAGSTSVKLKLEDGSEYTHAGTLKFAEVAVDQATGSVTLRAEFPNPQGVLLPGMFVRAVIDAAVDPNAILVPQQGITRDAKGNAIALVVGAGDKVESRTVTTARTLADQWVVTGGLASGDRVIVEGTNKVRAGATVKPVTAGTATAAPAAAPAASSAATPAAPAPSTKQGS